MSNLLTVRDSIQNGLSMVYSLVQQVTSDDELLDDVQDTMNRILEIVKNKTANAKPAEFVAEIDKGRKERRAKEKKEKKDVTADGTGEQPIVAKTTRKQNASKSRTKSQ